MAKDKLIVLLRGINVSGKNMIKMAALKDALKNAGLPNAETYLQSGNLVVSTNMNESDTAEQVSTVIKNEFEYDVPAICIAAKNFEKMVLQNPFAKQYHGEEKSIYYTFFKETVVADTLLDAKYFRENEQLKIEKNIAYLYCPEGYGTTKLSNSFLEKKFKTLATTRNHQTSMALIEMSK